MHVQREARERWREGERQAGDWEGVGKVRMKRGVRGGVEWEGGKRSQVSTYSLCHLLQGDSHMYMYMCNTCALLLCPGLTCRSRPAGVQ